MSGANPKARAARAAWLVLAVVPCALAALSATLPSAALAARSVAIPDASGPANSGAEKLDKQVRAQLILVGLEIVADKALARAAKKLDGDPATTRVAKEAGADLLVVLTVKKTKKSFSATGKLIDTSTDKVIKVSKKKYKKATSAVAIGDVIGRELAEAASGAASSAPAVAAGGGGGDDDYNAADDDDDAPRATPAKSAAPREERAATTTSPAVTPKDEADAGASTTISRARGGAGAGELKTLQLSVGAGSQVTSAYTVAVSGQPTGLAYNLSPLVLIAAGARVTIPNTGLSLELDFSFVPVKYNIDVLPAVMPQQPNGTFINLGISAAYRLDLATFDGGRFYLAPVAGIVYASLAVEEQRDFSVVVGYSAIAPQAGARFGLALGALTIEAQGKVQIVVSYSESPEAMNTGNDGGGLGLDIGGGGRYWMSDNFGVFLTASYAFTRISLTGAGTRTPFEQDPKLENATIFSGNLKTALGVVLAL